MDQVRFFSALSTLGLVAALLTLGAAPASAAAPVATTAPSISGKAVVRGVLTVDTGAWTPVPDSLSVQWLRDGSPISGATARSRTATRSDLGRQLSARVSATNADGTTVVLTAPLTIRKAVFAVKRKPTIKGTARIGRTLTSTKPKFDKAPQKLRRQWLRDGKPVKGAKGKKFKVAASDVGHRIQVRWTAGRDGWKKRQVTSKKVTGKHKVGVRRVVTYSVETRGKVSASLPKFKKLAQQTYDDARGWRGGGVKFRRVGSGGNFTLVLAEASWLPRFSPVCSVQWSCRVGRYVVINQTRWQHASPAWNAAGGSLRGYRHMVVNHETGHWLGFGHASCPRSGAAAPVMQQQSKGLQGCRFNPFPTGSEQSRAR
ncbi:DUF3152 domain-containing protein [Nocardioides alcanivorans]|uniref:DUF3152 domain-containing protein n=1 Tax=Nocardioides alcanivorans TaxID=2897352 RepID=UPI001F19F1CD|nr:DUF3152 domain-containing protein [Nocardioides alcanivorans]